MRIVPGAIIELEYDSTLYRFQIISVSPQSTGFGVDIMMTPEFRHAFKSGEKLSRWSGQRFQKFLFQGLAQHLRNEMDRV